MNTTADCYLPFYNRRVSPDVRQLITERHRWREQAERRELRRCVLPSTAPVTAAAPTAHEPGAMFAIRLPAART